MIQEQLSDIICGNERLQEEEGLTFYYDNTVINIPDNNIVVAGSILHTVNSSNKFSTKLVKLGKSGDTITVGFDPLQNDKPIKTYIIGVNDEIQVDVKRHDKLLYIYINNKRFGKVFKALHLVSRYVNCMDRQLKVPVEEL